MAGIKIVDLPAVGRDLATTDLFEMSLAGGTGSRKITGQEIMNASKLNVGSTPVINGTVGRVLFEGTGNVLQQSGNLFWDNTNGRLGIGTSSPFNGLNATQSLQLANGTSNIDVGGFCSLGKITQSGYGAVGSNYYLDNLNALRRKNGDSVSVMDFSAAGFYFRNASNGATNSLISLNELASIRANGNMLIGTTTDAGFKLDVNGTARATSYTLGNYIINQASANIFTISNPSGASGRIDLYGGNTSQANIQIFGSSGGNTNNILFNVGSTVRAVIFGSTGNVGINTTTDDGFRLDVNGTARVQGQLTLNNSTFPQLNISGTTSNAGIFLNRASTSFSSQIRFQTAGSDIWTWQLQGNATNNLSAVYFNGSWQEAIRFNYATGNIGINTTTDAGFRLDVNGTARVQTSVQIGTQAQIQTFGGEAIYGTVGSIGTIYLQGSLVKIGNVTNTTISGGALGASLYNVLLSGNHTSSSSGTQSDITINPTLNFTSGTYVYRGIYYNPTITSLTGTTHHAFHSTSGRIRFEGLPTSPTGLSAGDLWNNGGVINIV
jgi:hypothetical protein